MVRCRSLCAASGLCRHRRRSTPANFTLDASCEPVRRQFLIQSRASGPAISLRIGQHLLMKELAREKRIAIGMCLLAADPLAVGKQPKGRCLERCGRLGTSFPEASKRSHLSITGFCGGCLEMTNRCRSQPSTDRAEWKALRTGKSSPLMPRPISPSPSRAMDRCRGALDENSGGRDHPTRAYHSCRKG